jgi:ankyrin repeat protein
MVLFVNEIILGKTQLKSKPKSLDKKDENGNSPLHLAATSGKAISVKPLIDSKAKLNARNKLGNL